MEEQRSVFGGTESQLERPHNRAYLHKRKTAGFGNIEARRMEASANLRNARHSRRFQDFKREVTESPDTSEVLDPEPVPEPVQATGSRQGEELCCHRRNALTKYLELKEAKKVAEKSKQRPPFLIGIPHHGSSPVMRDQSNNQGGRKAVPSSKNQITKVLSQSPVKEFPFKKSKFQFSFVLSTKPLTEPHTPQVLKRYTKKNSRLNNLSYQTHAKKIFKSKHTFSDALPSASSASQLDQPSILLGEALPPPGLHRMVTGQGTESISSMSVLGQPSSISHSNDSGFVRLVPGQQTPRDSPEPSSLERLIPGQQNNEDVISQRMVPGHYSQDSRFSSHQISQDELHRLIPGQVESEPPIGARMILGQQSDDENNISANEMDRMIPGEVSEHDNSLTGDVLDTNERMVPGGMSDDLRSQSINEARNSSERMIPVINETHQLQLDNTTERLVTGGGRTEVDDISNRSSNQDGVRHVTLETVNQPLPGLHRLVLGQTNTVNSTNSNLSAGVNVETPKNMTASINSPAKTFNTPKNILLKGKSPLTNVSNNKPS